MIGFINPTESNIYNSEYISNLVYLSLNEIATNPNVSIAICKNCGKYLYLIKGHQKNIAEQLIPKMKKFAKILVFKRHIRKKQNPCLSLY